MKIKIKKRVFIEAILIIFLTFNISSCKTESNDAYNVLLSSNDYKGLLDWSNAFYSNNNRLVFNNECKQKLRLLKLRRKRQLAKKNQLTSTRRDENILFKFNKKTIVKKSASFKRLNVSNHIEDSKRPRLRITKKSISQSYFKLLPNIIRNNCSYQACYPPIKNLLIGRKKYLFASSTCGMTIPERFCLLSNLPSRYPERTENRGLFDLYLNDNRVSSNCMECDSREPYEENYRSHRIENIVNDAPMAINNGYHIMNHNRNKWWQSENGKQLVFIQFDLESEFVLSHILIRFRTFPPASMFLEKSSDFGRTWRTLVYYAANCAESFPDIQIANRPSSLHQPYCISIYSHLPSTTKNELVYRPLAGAREHDPFKLQQLLKITNLRVNLTEMHMFGDNLIGFSEDIMAKYYYAINEMKIFGTCLCNGHASSCKQAKNIQYDKQSIHYMLHSECECQHNTDGTNCEKCLPLYNDVPWRAARYDSSNDCVKCICNNHSNSCHFDLKRYKETNETSGGVCEDCMHNTEGPNCEKCKRNFYRDENYPIDSPYACKPCKCNQIGTVQKLNQEPICYEKTCQCKMNVDGEKCNRCKNGYYDLSLNHPHGCKKCDCNVNGTINNAGCDKETGVCYPCKPNVVGPSCSACKTGYYGLSDGEEGCKPCNCNPGNSYSNECDQITGQCKCKPHTTGLKCNTFEEGYYCPNLDYIIFEAEDSVRLNDHSASHEKLEYVEAENLAWTGNGYLRVYEGGKIKFKFIHDYSTALYDVILRYEPSYDDWQDVSFRIWNLGSSYYNFTFQQSIACDDFAVNTHSLQRGLVNLNRNERSAHLYFKYCFEKYNEYEIEMDFYSTKKRRKIRSIGSQSAKETPSILIDSIVLLPDFEHILQKTDPEYIARLKVYDRAITCRRSYFSLPRKKSSSCEKFICQVTIDLYGLFACQCDALGSESNICDQYGGQCPCKPYVFDRKCDKCTPTSWGFSENGCQLCNCDSSGSLNDQCDLKNGQCECFENRKGRNCSECIDGYYDPPKCRKCDCNGFSETCTQSGVCIDCRGNTEGPNCESCEKGYYGAPMLKKPCQLCSCPGINGNNFAKDCRYDELADSFKCYCMPGYIGEKCQECDVFYYGNPLEMNGSCKKCECNGNNDMNSRESCDIRTGKCKNCLYSTFGHNCERCRPGYFGNAFKHDCKECKCNEFGTENNSKENCDSETGTCNCLPKVIGRHCDECAANYWNLDSGKGCEDCDCDITGTIYNSTSCDTKTGQCECLSDRGGRRCDECPFGYWGTPSSGCQKCDCDLKGVVSPQCNKTNGQCICLKGKAGERCDKCARGTINLNNEEEQNEPICQNCGECFDNWDLVISSVTNELINIQKKQMDHFTGALKSKKLIEFNNEYNELEEKINDIKYMLRAANGYSRFDRRSLTSSHRQRNLEYLNRTIITLRNKMAEQIDDYNKKLFQISKWNLTLPLEEIKKKSARLNNFITKAIEECYEGQEGFIKVYSIDNSFRESEDAVNTLRDASISLKNSLRPLLNNISYTLESSAETLTEYDIKMVQVIDESKKKLDELNADMLELNKLVCDNKPLNYSENFEIFHIRNQCNEDSLYSVWLKLSDLADYHKKIYTERINEIKDNLTLLTNRKFLMKKNYDDIIYLSSILNSTYERIKLHNNLISNLLQTAFDQSDNYLKRNQHIEESCVYFKNNKQIDSLINNYEMTNKKFEEILTEINKYNKALYHTSQKIINENKKALLEAKFIRTKADKDEEENNEAMHKLNEYHLMKKKIDENLMSAQSSLETFKTKNSEIYSRQAFTNKTLEAINHNLTRINEETNETMKIVNNQNKESLNKVSVVDLRDMTFRIDTIKANLSTSSKEIKQLKAALEKIFSIFEKSNNDPKTREKISLIIDLQNQIRIRDSEIRKKRHKLAELELKQNETKKKLTYLKHQMSNLTVEASKLKADLSDKLQLYKSCQ